MSLANLDIIVLTPEPEKQQVASKNEDTYCLNRDVVMVIENGIAQLLDFNRGHFYGLNPMGTLMLSLILEENLPQAVAEIASTYQISVKEVEKDANSLLEKLERQKLLVNRTKRSHLFGEWIVPLVKRVEQFYSALYIWVLQAISSRHKNSLPQSSSQTNIITSNLPTVDLLLSFGWLSFRLIGWNRTISCWQRSPYPVDKLEQPNAKDIIATVDRIIGEAAAKKLLFPIACKERALVGYYLLRNFYGLPATLVVGIDRHPFQLHAWVECEGEVVTDDPAHCQPFTPVVRYS